MADKSKEPKEQDNSLSLLNIAIDALNRAKEAEIATPAQTAFTLASVLLTMIRDSMVSEVDYVKLGLTCASVCEALNRGMNRRRADQLSQSILEAVGKLTMIVTEVQGHVIKRARRNPISRRYHAKGDKNAVIPWIMELDGIRHSIDTELGINTDTTASGTNQDAGTQHAIFSDVQRDVGNRVANTLNVISGVHRDKLEICESADGQNQAAITTRVRPTTKQTFATAQAHASAPGESPPPLPGNTHGANSNIRRGVSEIHRDLMNTQTVVYDIRNILKGQEGAGGQLLSAENSVSGELPPPPPRVFFGRGELVERIVSFAERLTPIALIGVGGIGKTSIILSVLHDDRVKGWFGDCRWFIRCDQFSASRVHFLRRFSKVVGAGVENPEDLTPLRQYLSSKKMFIVLDNAESILDPQGVNAQEIYGIVDELARFSNICLCVTSRVSTIPPSYETLEIPTLSVEAAHDTFYRIYKHGERCDSVSDILEQLDFHPLSVALLATVAQHNKWGGNRLIREWEGQRTGVLRAQHSGSFAATIELSLASPMFRGLGPDARGLLEVAAFFPQGVDEENIDWLFSTISYAPHVFDTFCILSLTYRSNGFITMLAPLRDHLRPKDPMTSPLLNTTKKHYFARLSAKLDPGLPSFGESRWITSEDVNVEHLLDIFASVDPNSEDIWDAYDNFLNHLRWHKPRLTVLGAKIEALSDNHPSKARCLDMLSRLFGAVGNEVGCQRILTHTSKLWREKGDDGWVANTLLSLSDANRMLCQEKEAIEQAREASEIFERLGDTVKQAECFICLARALYDDRQLDAAEEAALRGIELLPESDQQTPVRQFLVCQGHRVLGDVYSSKGETEKAAHHFEIALGIATTLGIPDNLFWIHYEMAVMFSEQGRFDAAHDHVERAKLHANNAYRLGRAMGLRAGFWFEQRMFEEARLEASRAVDAYGKVGATRDIERCRLFLREIDGLNLDGAGQQTARKSRWLPRFFRTYPRAGH